MRTQHSLVLAAAELIIAIDAAGSTPELLHAQCLAVDLQRELEKHFETPPAPGIIKPTVGRMVHFYPPRTFLGRLTDGSPLAAVIARVWCDSCVNLTVFDFDGHPVAVSSVYLVQGDTPIPDTAYACWMPYQKGQAAKTEALQAQLDKAA